MSEKMPIARATRAIEDVRMTIVTADALGCKQAVFNVESVRPLLDLCARALEILGVMERDD